MRRGAGIVAVVLAAAGIWAGTAQGAPRQESLFQDDDLLLYSPPDTVDATMRELKALGVDRVRLSVIWTLYAPASPPADPADPRQYDPAKLDTLDTAVTAAAANGLQVLLNLRGGVPPWAQRGPVPRSLRSEDAVRPDPAAFRAFAQMLGRRYDGSYADENGTRAPLPRVSAWSTWNEPNWGGLLQPQSQRDPKTKRMHPVAPALYRDLHRAAVSGLAASGHGGDVILIGETAPVGVDQLGARKPLQPLRFLRDLFCLNRKLRPLKGRAARLARCDFKQAGALPGTGYAHHPYPVKQPPEQRSKDRDVVRLADAGRLQRILDAARRHGRLPGRLPIWYTEFGYQTRPPDPFRGIALGRHAAWLMRAERQTFADRRVLASHQFLLRDAAPNAAFAPSERRYWSTYQTGLRFADGRRKPAYAAYRLPFLALDRIRAGRPLRLWGMVRPGTDGQPQAVRVEHRPRGGGGWRPVRELTVTDPKGYFTVRLPRARAGRYRFAWLAPGEPPVASPPAVRSR